MPQGTRNVADGTEELTFKFLYYSINLHLNSCLWLVAIELDSTGLERARESAV